MAIPEGYTKLAKIGLVYKYDFVEGTTYEKLDSVYYQGSTYVALIDNPQGEPIDDNVNWKYVAKGFPSDIDEVEINFEEAQTRENISTGEKIGVIFGKIKKWFSDLTSVAFSQPISSYDDVMANTVAGYTPDALAVKEGFTEVNNNLADSGWQYAGVVRYRKIGKMVEINRYSYAEAKAGVSTVLGTLPEGFRPPYTVSTTLALAPNIVTALYVQPDGIINIAPSVDITTQPPYNMTFFVN